MIFKLAAFLVDEFLLVLIQTLIADHANHAHMAVDRITNLGNQRRRVFSAALEIPPLGIKDAAELFHEEGHIAPFAEHRRDDPGECNNPLEVIHIL